MSPEQNPLYQPLSNESGVCPYFWVIVRVAFWVLTGSQSTKVRIQAMNALAARGQLNAMYGLANVVSLPIQVKV